MTLAEYQWFHSIDLPGGTTPGAKSGVQLAGELAGLQLPDLNGKTVLDIGSWDGFFSFAAEGMGAERVVALDYHAWGADFNTLPDRWRDWRAAKGRAGSDFWDTPGALDLDGLPGRRGFDRAHRELSSAVEPVVGDFMTMDLATLGRFDVTLFLGVLYHVRHPLLALERLASITNWLAVIETEALADHSSSCIFLSGDELNRDPTNWWIPTEAALKEMCLAAGFSRVDIIRSHRRVTTPWANLWRRAKRLARGRSDNPPLYRAVVHAYR